MPDEKPQALTPSVKAASPSYMPYSSSISQMAMQPTLLEELSANAAQAQANKNATMLGIEHGKNPHTGIMSPPLTKADEYYQKAYFAQSQNSLNNQLNNLFSSANVEMSKSPRISPDVLSAYTSNLNQGMEQILGNAPAELRAALENQYKNTLLQNSSKLQLRMIKEQQADAKASMASADQVALDNIYDMALSGNPEAAKSAYENQLKQNELNFASMLKDENEFRLSNDSAKLTYFSGLAVNRLNVAREFGGTAVAEYLEQFNSTKNKPEELTFEQWKAVGKAVLAQATFQDKVDARERTNVIADLKYKIGKQALGLENVTENDLQTALKNPALTEADRKNLYLDFLQASVKKSKIGQEQTTLDMNWQSIDAHAHATKDTVNKVYLERLQDLDEKYPNENHYEHAVQVAATAGGPVPEFLNLISSLSNRAATMEQMDTANSMYRRIKRLAPANVQSLDKDVIETLDAFETYNKIYAGNPDAAFANVQKIRQQLTSDERNIIENNAAEYRKKNLATPEQRNKFARNMISPTSRIPFFGKAVPIEGEAEAIHTVNNLFRSNLDLYRGDAEAAKVQTERQVDEMKGTTFVNGIEQISLTSLEKNLDLSEGGTFAVQQDVVEQLEDKFSVLNEANAKGNWGDRFEIINRDFYSTDNLKEAVQKQAQIDSAEQIRDVQYEAEMNSIDEKIQQYAPYSFNTENYDINKYKELLNEKKSIQAKYAAISLSKYQAIIDSPDSSPRQVLDAISRYSGAVNKYDPSSSYEVNISLQDKWDKARRQLSYAEQKQISPDVQTRRTEIAKKHEPIKIRRYYKTYDGTEISKDYNLVINSAIDTKQYQNQENIYGPFDLTLLSDDGDVMFIPDITGPPAAKITYTAHVNKIKRRDREFASNYLDGELRKNTFLKLRELQK